MSAVVCGFLVCFAQYILVSKPAQEHAHQAELAQAAAQQALAADQARGKGKGSRRRASQGGR